MNRVVRGSVPNRRTGHFGSKNLLNRRTGLSPVRNRFGTAKKKKKKKNIFFDKFLKFYFLINNNIISKLL